MRKAEKRFITIGLILIFAAIGWYAYSHQSAGPAVLLNINNQTNNSTTYTLSISDLNAVPDQATGHVMVTFNLTNAKHFNISNVQILYALNVANPANATYSVLNTTLNGTYKATIPSKFGDAVYYKVKVTYNSGKTLESKVQTIIVKDTTAPTATLSIKYNATTGKALITINASDNNAVGKVILFYAVTNTSNLTNVTFSNVTLNTNPYTYTLTVDSNTTDSTYYYLNTYAKVYDLSGNMARVPTNGTLQFYANETKIVSG